MAEERLQMAWNPILPTRIKRAIHVLMATMDHIMLMNQSIRLPSLLVILFQEPQFRLAALL
jgi:hypothetical protein